MFEGSPKRSLKYTALALALSAMACTSQVEGNPVPEPSNELEVPRNVCEGAPMLRDAVDINVTPQRIQLLDADVLLAHQLAWDELQLNAEKALKGKQIKKGSVIEVAATAGAMQLPRERIEARYLAAHAADANYGQLTDSEAYTFVVHKENFTFPPGPTGQTFLHFIPQSVGECSVADL